MSSNSIRNTQHSYSDWIARLKCFGYKCYWCEKPLTEVTACKDHLQPISRGGTDQISNVVPACFPCNQRKGIRNEAEFRAQIAGACAKKSTSIALLEEEKRDADLVSREIARTSWAWRNPR